MKAALHWLLVAGAVAYVSYQAPTLVHSALAAGGDPGHLRWDLVAASAALGLAAVAIYAELHRQLLKAGNAQVPFGVVQTITLAENAIAATVPVVGGAGSIAYAISRFRRRGVDSAVAGWAVLLAGALDTLCLIILAAVALAAVGRLPVPVAAVAVVAISAGAVGAWMLVTHPPALRAVLRPVVSLDRFLPTRCRPCRTIRAADLDGTSSRVVARLGLLRPSPARWLLLLAITVASWVTDFANLAVAAAAALPAVPWQALIVGFLVVQASIALQVLPGGAGLAAVGLLGSMVAAGVGPGPAAVVVLIYRGTSWLLPAAVGWISYGVHVHLTQPVPHRHLPSCELQVALQ